MKLCFWVLLCKLTNQLVSVYTSLLTFLNGMADRNKKRLPLPMMDQFLDPILYLLWRFVTYHFYKNHAWLYSEFLTKKEQEIILYTKVGIRSFWYNSVFDAQMSNRHASMPMVSLTKKQQKILCSIHWFLSEIIMNTVSSSFMDYINVTFTQKASGGLKKKWACQFIVVHAQTIYEPR